LLLVAGGCRTILEEWKEKRSWLPEEDTAKLLEMMEAVEEWVVEQEALQAEKQPFEEPAYFAEAIEDKLRPIAKYAHAHTHTHTHKHTQTHKHT
jgi:hypothetical protein